ncbi:MAG: hypothetical protein RL141_519 [Candidatus Parcubacteria bacterium]
MRLEVADEGRPPEGSGPLPLVAEPVATETHLERKSLDGDIEHVSYSFSTTTRAHLELYGFSQEAYQFRLAAADEAKSLAAWRDASEPTVVAGINGMYFLEDFSPAGFLVTEGEEQRDHPFDWDKSALLTIADNGALAIRATTQEPTDLAELTHAAQSYPLLVLNGTANLSEDSGKVARRSIVGTDTDGRVWIGVVLEGNISLYQLSQVLMKTGISWKNVLNLDGGPSSGLFLRGADEVFFSPFTAIPSVLFVEKR